MYSKMGVSEYMSVFEVEGVVEVDYIGFVVSCFLCFMCTMCYYSFSNPFSLGDLFHCGVLFMGQVMMMMVVLFYFSNSIVVVEVWNLGYLFFYFSMNMNKDGMSVSHVLYNSVFVLGLGVKMGLVLVGFSFSLVGVCCLVWSGGDGSVVLLYYLLIIKSLLISLVFWLYSYIKVFSGEIVLIVGLSGKVFFCVIVFGCSGELVLVLFSVGSICLFKLFILFFLVVWSVGIGLMGFYGYSEMFLVGVVNFSSFMFLMGSSISLSVMMFCFLVEVVFFIFLIWQYCFMQDMFMVSFGNKGIKGKVFMVIVLSFLFSTPPFPQFFLEINVVWVVIGFMNYSSVCDVFLVIMVIYFSFVMFFCGSLCLICTDLNIKVMLGGLSDSKGGSKMLFFIGMYSIVLMVFIFLGGLMVV